MPAGTTSRDRLQEHVDASRAVASAPTSSGPLIEGSARLSGKGVTFAGDGRCGGAVPHWKKVWSTNPPDG